MARIDSVLAIVASQGANELRLGTDREPKMLAYGIAKRLAIPVMDEDTLRSMLGEILSPERDQAMRERGRIEVPYEAASLGTFQVTLTARDKGFDALFMKSARPKDAPMPAARTVSQPAPIAPVMLVATVSQEMPVPVIHAQPPPSSPRAREGSAALDDRIARASALRASDLHLGDHEPARVRVDGVLRNLDDPTPVDVAELLGFDAADRQKLDRGESIDDAREVPDVGRVRIHAYRTADGLAASIRLLPHAAPSLASLHLPVPLDDLVTLPNGLVLVCGATGSGKSTTLAALAQEALRRRSIVLTTLEDPIEYALEAGDASIVRRRQVGRDVPDFARGLRDALREDPDVLIVGEMRDQETISLALTAAETGHLVLASIHARSTASAVERIVDSYPAAREKQIRSQLADSLRAAIAQRLLPRARGAGRVPALEVLRVTHAVGTLIREGKNQQIASTLQSSRKEGMIALERSLADLVTSGEVKLSEAQAAANDLSTLATYLAK